MRRDARGHSVKWERQQTNLWLTFMLWQRFRRDLFTHSTAACSSLPFSTYPESTPPSRLNQINLQVCNEHYSVSKLQNLVSWPCSVCITKALSKDRYIRYLLSYELWLWGRLLLIKTYWSHFILGGLNYYVLTSKNKCNVLIVVILYCNTLLLP